jgi:glutamyl-tRNA reductase
MSALVVGISHKSAPVAVLERVALDEDGVRKLLTAVMGSEHVCEAVVLSTCNRVEVYAEVDRFHGGVEDVSGLLAERAGTLREDVVPHLYVQYDEAAVAHLFSVASGLDSMVVGESQVLGQVRHGLRLAQDQGSVGPSLNALFQQALRVGKRGHAETGIDRAAPSIVAAALDRAQTVLGPLERRRVLVVGAGAVARMAAAALAARGARGVAVANRTGDRAERLAESVGGRAVGWESLPETLAGFDLVVAGTGAIGTVISAGSVRRAVAERPSTQPYVLVDLALPHDVDPDVGSLPGVTLINLAALAPDLKTGEQAADVEQVRAIVAAEVSSFLAARAGAGAAPAVVALRSMATEVVEVELARLRARTPHLDQRSFDEVAQAVRRVADKLLHIPTVRIKQLADEAGAFSPADVLADLFSLDPRAVEALTRADLPKPGDR